MREIHEQYVKLFIEFGEKTLSRRGLYIQIGCICGPSASTEIHLSDKDANIRFIVTFATNHLDYNLGVCVYEKKGTRVLVLPEKITESTRIYTYMGDNCDTDILRLIQAI